MGGSIGGGAVLGGMTLKSNFHLQSASPTLA